MHQFVIPCGDRPTSSPASYISDRPDSTVDRTRRFSNQITIRSISADVRFERACRSHIGPPG